ncbi:hypothetical protein CPB85DRAFT_1230889 [Mucidula mucida]|nr:hypothetical protein CPB85DRAFT_1230889 [Mucidula mucida]
MRRDEEHRQRSGLVWDNLKADQGCLSFASRRYTAELVNVPTDPDVDGLKWCMETQIEIHGAMYEHPRRCDKIIAEWITHSNEPTCRTFWDHHTKKGCNGNHKRIFEAKLENHQPPWDNWQEMCVSTPSHFNYGHHDHPDICRETVASGPLSRNILLTISYRRTMGYWGLVCIR